MIVVELKGGLGNQMFQWALGRALSVHYNKKLFLDIEGLKILDESLFVKRDFELEIFNMGINVFDNRYSKLFFPGSNLTMRLWKKLFRYNVISEKEFGYNPFELDVGHSYIKGYFQSEKYFEHITDILKMDFQFVAKKNHETLRLQKDIVSTNSISMHIRRGDYVNGESTSQTHGFLGLEYYTNAIGFFQKKYDNPKFYLFSDDAKWVKEQLQPMCLNAICVEHNIGMDSWQDMFLMSMCKHNVIANSTFSWWGAWLNTNEEKIVISPRRWFLNEELNNQTNYLIPDSWLRV